MKDVVTKLEQQTKNIQSNLEYIRQNLSKVRQPIIIELIGTPKSGKTTLITNLEKLFTNSGISIKTRQETAEYNPIENKDLPEYNIWMIMELMKNLSEDLSEQTSKIIIYDRGVLDRIPWIDLAVEDGIISKEDANSFRQLYSTQFLRKYKPIAYGLFTSPNNSVQRKGKEGRLVNRRNVARFNKRLGEEEETIQDGADKYTIIQTDEYQGQLKRFILEMSETITADIKEKIKELEFEEIGGFYNQRD